MQGQPHSCPTHCRLSPDPGHTRGPRMNHNPSQPPGVSLLRQKHFYHHLTLLGDSYTCGHAQV